jgi:tetratricopeptide (TPR) repeat protein
VSDSPFQPILLDLLQYARSAQDAFVQALDPTERAAIGSPTHWSAKDHVAHMTFWRQQLNLKLQAILRQQTPTGMDDYEQMNSIVFERQRQRPWSAILAESDHAYAELISLTDQLSDEELSAFGRFEWIPDGWPLYITYMGNCYEHTAQHLAQYYLDRQDRSQALRTYEAWVERIVQAAAPDTLKGYVLYNLACFYAMHAEVEQAMTTAQQAWMLHPPLKEFARSDPDLVAVRSHLTGVFSE